MSKLNKEKLLQEIREKGVEISSINDLMKIDKNYKALVPIILQHLQQITDEGDKQFLVRCLGVKGFDEATEPLINEFLNSSNVSYKWAIGNTLYNIMNKGALNILLKIAQEKKHGIARQMIVLAIGKMGDQNVIPVLLGLLNDEDVTGHVITALSNFKDATLIPHIEPFMKHKVNWISGEAKKTIKKLGK